MSRIHPECPASDPCDRSAAADVVLRQEPDEEEDEEEEEEDEEEEKKTKVTRKKGMMMTTKILATQCERALICRRVKDEARTFHQGC
jgi:hypothetical protein